MANDRLPSQEVLRQLLSYDRETGQLLWKERPESMFISATHSAAHQCKKWNARFANKPALNCSDDGGYKHGTLLGVDVKAHRVIWKMETGVEPVEVDHEKGKRSDNRFSEMRDATHAQNKQNMARSVRNTSGQVGVRWSKTSSKWQAFITHDYKLISLGFYAEFENAVTARKTGELKYNFHENHGREAMRLVS